MPTPIDVINQFCELFDGNHTAVGTEEGGCERMADPVEDWYMYVEGHVRGVSPPVGVYPMVKASVAQGRFDDHRYVVKWGCVDFDEGEEISWGHARNLYEVLKQFNIQAWLERSRSKGYHVWIFLEDWTDADTVRRALLAACQVVGAPTKEINPKQSSLSDGQLGNYVRLPYPGWLSPDYRDVHNGKRAMVSLDGLPHSLGWFTDVAAQTLVTQREVEDLASYYIPPSAQHKTVGRLWDSVLEGEAVDRLRGKARIIFEQGPLESEASSTNFRGQTLFKLASYLHEDGQHSPAEALELLRDADSRWGKYHERPDGEQRLEDLVIKVFGEL